MQKGGLELSSQHYDPSSPPPWVQRRTARCYTPAITLQRSPPGITDAACPTGPFVANLDQIRSDRRLSGMRGSALYRRHKRDEDRIGDHGTTTLDFYHREPQRIYPFRYHTEDQGDSTHGLAVSPCMVKGTRSNQSSKLDFQAPKHYSTSEASARISPMKLGTTLVPSVGALPVQTGKKVQYRKTKVCPWNAQGRCVMGSQCNYAHANSELRNRPDLTCTRLCPDGERCERRAGGACRFAHNSNELRATGAFFRTKLCKFWLKGSCPSADMCRHAHGDDQLRRPESCIKDTNPASCTPLMSSAIPPPPPPLPLRCSPPVPSPRSSAASTEDGHCSSLSIVSRADEAEDVLSGEVAVASKCRGLKAPQAGTLLLTGGAYRANVTESPQLSPKISRRISQTPSLDLTGEDDRSRLREALEVLIPPKLDQEQMDFSSLCETLLQGLDNSKSCDSSLEQPIFTSEPGATDSQASVFYLDSGMRTPPPTPLPLMLVESASSPLGAMSPVLSITADAPYRRQSRVNTHEAADKALESRAEAATFGHTATILPSVRELAEMAMSPHQHASVPYIDRDGSPLVGGLLTGKLSDEGATSMAALLEAASPILSQATPLYPDPSFAPRSQVERPLRNDSVTELKLNDLLHFAVFVRDPDLLECSAKLLRASLKYSADQSRAYAQIPTFATRA